MLYIHSSYFWGKRPGWTPFALESSACCHAEQVRAETQHRCGQIFALFSTALLSTSFGPSCASGAHWFLKVNCCPVLQKLQRPGNGTEPAALWELSRYELGLWFRARKETAVTEANLFQIGKEQSPFKKWCLWNLLSDRATQTKDRFCAEALGHLKKTPLAAKANQNSASLNAGISFCDAI